LSKFSKAKLFSEIGKKTDIFVRFSGFFLEQGDPETSRDPRGFSIKFYTEEGNWDLLAINTPVFFVKDGKLGPDAIHAFKRDPRTFEWNPTMLWDFVVNHPESIHQTLMTFSDRVGTPSSYRSMDAYGCNTFSFINDKNERFWVKFHLVSTLESKCFNLQQAQNVAGEEPNFLSKDLRCAIESGDYPRWKLSCQIMPEEDGYKNTFTFDCTKVWCKKDYPLIDIGEVQLNKMPIDYFSEVEQSAFSPANIVPGIGLSPDKLLQARVMMYDDAQYHRLGPNYKQIEVNCPLQPPRNYYYAGSHQKNIKSNFPNYFPSFYEGPHPNPSYIDPPLRCDGKADYYDYLGHGTDQDYFEQPGKFFHILNTQHQQNLIENITYSLLKVKEENIVRSCFQMFYKVDKGFGERVENTYKSKKENFEKKSMSHSHETRCKKTE